MAAQVRDGICRGAPPLVGVLANQLVHATDLAFPTLVLPRTAHRENTAKPRRLFREVFQFLAITELPRPARAVQQKQHVIAGEPAIFPVLEQGADISNDARDS